jgi:protein-S-isoprenylcysteine O-methyltransferase Ste14
MTAAVDTSKAAPLAAAGRWVFRQRSWTPVPLALVLLVVRWHAVRSPLLFSLGALLALGGLAVRSWGVSHIGTISTLMTGGPYSVVRNPLYVGNLLLWLGCAVASGLLWMVPVALIVFAIQYSAIASLLVERYGDEYREYARDVPRWRPRLDRLAGALKTPPLWGWRDVLFSERGTLIAAAVTMLLLAARYRWWL